MSVSPGDSVIVGEEIACLEAMKMRNVIRAERSGTVKPVHASVGATLQPEDILIEFEDDDNDDDDDDAEAEP